MARQRREELERQVALQREQIKLLERLPQLDEQQRRKLQEVRTALAANRDLIADMETRQRRIQGGIATAGQTGRNVAAGVTASAAGSVAVASPIVFEQFTLAFKDLAAVTGQILIPVIERVTAGVRAVADVIVNLGDGFKGLIGDLGSAAVAVGVVTFVVSKLAAGVLLVGGAISWLAGLTTRTAAQTTAAATVQAAATTAATNATVSLIGTLGAYTASVAAAAAAQQRAALIAGMSAAGQSAAAAGTKAAGVGLLGGLLGGPIGWGILIGSVVLALKGLFSGGDKSSVGAAARPAEFRGAEDLWREGMRAAAMSTPSGEDGLPEKMDRLIELAREGNNMARVEAARRLGPQEAQRLLQEGA